MRRFVPSALFASSCSLSRLVAASGGGACINASMRPQTYSVRLNSTQTPSATQQQQEQSGSQGSSSPPSSTTATATTPAAASAMSSSNGLPTLGVAPTPRTIPYPPPFTVKEVRVAVLPLLPVSGPGDLQKVLSLLPPRMKKYLVEDTGFQNVQAYFHANLGGDVIVNGNTITRRADLGKTGATSAREIPQAPPPPPPSSFMNASKPASPFSQLHQAGGVSGGTQQGFRSPSEVLDVLIDYIPTFAINISTLVEHLPPDVTAMFGSLTPLMFLRKYRFYFDVQQHHGVPEVKLRPEVAHIRRGIADVKYASGIGAADYLMNNSPAAGGGGGAPQSGGIRKPPRNSEANLVMGLAPKCPTEFTPIGEFLSNVHTFVSTHPAFDQRIGATGLLEKYPEYFQIVDGKIRIRPSSVAPGSIGEYSVTDSPLKAITEKLVAALPMEDGKTMETPALFGKLLLEEKQAIKQTFRSFPRYLRMHGKVFVVSPDNTLLKRFVPELERSADALASERLENDSLSPSDPIHNIPALMDVDSSADWSVKELYDALPLMQAAELDDFKMILTTSVRDALPKDLAGELAKHPDYFSVWQYPDDESVTIVQRAKLTTPDFSADELARAMVPMVPQGGLTTDQLLRRVPLPIQRYLYKNGVKKVIETHLTEYFIVSGNRVMKKF